MPGDHALCDRAVRNRAPEWHPGKRKCGIAVRGGSSRFLVAPGRETASCRRGGLKLRWQSFVWHDLIVVRDFLARANALHADREGSSLTIAPQRAINLAAASRTVGNPGDYVLGVPFRQQALHAGVMSAAAVSCPPQRAAAFDGATHGALPWTTGSPHQGNQDRMDIAHADALSAVNLVQDVVG